MTHQENLPQKASVSQEAFPLLEEEQLEAVAGAGCLGCFTSSKKPKVKPIEPNSIGRTPSGNSLFHFAEYGGDAHEARNNRDQPENWQVVEGDLAQVPGHLPPNQHRLIHILRPVGTRSSAE